MKTLHKNQQRNIALFVIFLSLGMMLSGNATTYYVATTGSDASLGTSTTTAWRHISYATGKVKAGDIVYVKAGNYGNEKVVMTINGTSTNPIRFEGYKNTPGDNPQLNYKYGDALDAAIMPLLDGNNRATGGTAIQLNSRSYVIVKNFQVRNYDVGIYAYGAQHLTIDNIIASTFGDVTADYEGKGIAVGSSAFYNTIKNCIILNAGAEGLSVTGDNNLIDNCKVYCNEVPIDPATDYYIIVAGNSNTVTGCYVERVGNLEHLGHGISLKTNCVNNTISDCVAKNMAGEGFCVRHRGVKNNVFENCIAYGGAGFVVRDGASKNLFSKCRSTGSDVAAMFYDTSEDGGAQYVGRNNIFENCIFESSGTVIDFDIYNQVSTVDSNAFINCTISGGDYLFNIARPNNTNKMINCIVTGITNYKRGSSSLNFSYTYTDFWSNGFTTPSGTGNISVNPLFVDAANGNYQLKTGSPCINAGTNTGAPAFDFNGTIRPQGSGYDIGAYEYPANTCAASSVPNGPGNLTAVASANKIDLTWIDNSGLESAYIIERSLNGTAFTQIASLPPNTTTYSNTGLAGNTKYYYRVMATNCLGNSTYSTVVNATTTISTAIEEYAISPINIYPNPFSTSFTINISSGINLENAVLKIYDLYGKEVKGRIINNSETVIDRDELPNGIYFYYIINDNVSIDKGKLIVQ